MMLLAFFLDITLQWLPFETIRVSYPLVITDQMSQLTLRAKCP